MSQETFYGGARAPGYTEYPTLVQRVAVVAPGPEEAIWGGSPNWTGPPAPSAGWPKDFMPGEPEQVAAILYRTSADSGFEVCRGFAPGDGSFSLRAGTKNTLRRLAAPDRPDDAGISAVPARIQIA